MKHLKSIEAFQKENVEFLLNNENLTQIQGGTMGTLQQRNYSTDPCVSGGDTDCGVDIMDDNGKVLQVIKDC